jgi:hypothetical protein
MKRVWQTTIAGAALAVVSLGCGCSAGVAPAVGRPSVAPDPSVIAITSVMSAQLPGPAPRVGKSHLAVDEEPEGPGAPQDSEAPKTSRRSDGSRRSGSFGALK